MCKSKAMLDWYISEYMVSLHNFKSGIKEPIQPVSLFYCQTFILRRITRSAAWREEYDQVMKSMGLELESLIAAYGIRWNIKYISREKAWKARDVGFLVCISCVISLTDTNLFIYQFIDQLLKDDLARVHAKHRRPRKNGKPHGYFHELTITPSEWAQVRNLNAELKVSLSNL